MHTSPVVDYRPSEYRWADSDHLRTAERFKKKFPRYKDRGLHEYPALLLTLEILNSIYSTYFLLEGKVDFEQVVCMFVEADGYVGKCHKPREKNRHVSGITNNHAYRLIRYILKCLVGHQHHSHDRKMRGAVRGVFGESRFLLYETLIEYYGSRTFPTKINTTKPLEETLVDIQNADIDAASELLLVSVYNYIQKRGLRYINLRHEKILEFVRTYHPHAHNSAKVIREALKEAVEMLAQEQAIFDFGDDILFKKERIFRWLDNRDAVQGAPIDTTLKIQETNRQEKAAMTQTEKIKQAFLELVKKGSIPYEIRQSRGHCEIGLKRPGVYDRIEEISGVSKRNIGALVSQTNLLKADDLRSHPNPHLWLNVSEEKLGEMGIVIPESARKPAHEGLGEDDQEELEAPSSEVETGKVETGSNLDENIDPLDEENDAVDVSDATDDRFEDIQTSSEKSAGSEKIFHTNGVMENPTLEDVELDRDTLKALIQLPRLLERKHQEAEKIRREIEDLEALRDSLLESWKST